MCIDMQEGETFLMKKLLVILVSLFMVFTLAACNQGGGNTNQGGETPAAPTEITLWTYPIGGWGNQDTVNALISKFEAANPDVKVTVEYLDYTNGDDQVNTAIEGGEAPDLIMEGPERLVANWGAKGLMVDLSDIVTMKSALNPSTIAASTYTDGKVFEYPVCMTAHCMAVNLTRLQAACEKAGIQLSDVLDVESHTWTTDGFLKAVEVLRAYDPNTTVAALYCSGQGGDQGTRAIVNNMYGGTFTNPEHTKYTADSPENIKALETLYATDGIKFDASINGGEEIQLFRQGQLQMAFCWNIAQQLNSDNAPAEKTNDGEDILFMAFPAQVANESKLCGGIWGFGIFNNGDDAKVAAAKKFISYFCEGDGTADAVAASTYFPVRDVAVTYASGADIMAEYNKLMPMLGDYYQVTTNWAEARTAWWNMLQRIGAGGDVATEVKAFCDEANK